MKNKMMKKWDNIFDEKSEGFMVPVRNVLTVDLVYNVFNECRNKTLLLELEIERKPSDRIRNKSLAAHHMA